MKLRWGTQEDLVSDSFRSIAMKGMDTGDGVIPVEWDRVWMVADECRLNGFGMVAEHDGRIVAYLGAIVTPSIWNFRPQATVVGWFSEHHGAGIALFKEMLKWWRRRPMAGIIHVAFNCKGEKIGRFLKHYGAVPASGFVLRG